MCPVVACAFEWARVEGEHGLNVADDGCDVGDVDDSVGKVFTRRGHGRVDSPVSVAMSWCSCRRLRLRR